MSTQIRLAYYCSGHGYGHATRVSAFASALMSLKDKPEIYVVSSAPTHVFSECISRGVHYRHAEIDPIISQPLAYKVDRRRSVQILHNFLLEKDDKLAVEVAWLSSTRIDCVLSDSAFLACEAATMAYIPSILITNFTFDAVYSYLGTEISECSHGLPDGTLHVSNQTTAALDDPPIPLHVLEPLVSQLLAGYRHADTLLLLPGFIPIPSFFPSPPLPATTWVDPSTNRFRPEIESGLLALSTSQLCPSIPFPVCKLPSDDDVLHRKLASSRKPPRTVKFAPLLVRPASPGINSREGRIQLLASIGIPEAIRELDQTRILLVSFGGQIVRRPRSRKRSSRMPPLLEEVNYPTCDLTCQPGLSLSQVSEPPEEYSGHSVTDITRPTVTFARRGSMKIFIPGAPTPANNPLSPHSPTSPKTVSTVRCGPDGSRLLISDAATSPTNPTLPPAAIPDEKEPSLLPSSSWIAIICGVPSNWSLSGEEDEDLPPGFYVAPRDVYMPDLTAIADVLLGKLGYGTVSESVAQSTPFVYVPRPLFVEEHGLRLLLEAEGTGVELSRHEYETGQWAKKVEKAYRQGKKVDHTKNRTENEQEVMDLAGWVVENVRTWKNQKT